MKKLLAKLQKKLRKAMASGKEKRVAAVEKVLDRLKKKRKSLEKRIENAKKKSERKKLQQKLKLVNTQRAKARPLTVREVCGGINPDPRQSLLWQANDMTAVYWED